MTQDRVPWAPDPIAVRRASQALRDLDLLVKELGDVGTVQLQAHALSGVWRDVDLEQAKVAARHGATVRCLVEVRGRRETDIDALILATREESQRRREEPTEVHAGVVRPGQFGGWGEL